MWAVLALRPDPEPLEPVFLSLLCGVHSADPIVPESRPPASPGRQATPASNSAPLSRGQEAAPCRLRVTVLCFRRPPL